MAKNTEITKNETAITSVNQIKFEVPEGFINTIDMSTDEGKNKVLKAINDAVSLNDYVGVELKICDCITMPGVRKGRNNNPDMPCQNTILVDVDGVAYFTQSDGIARNVLVYSMIYPDFGKNTSGYISMMVKEEQLPNGNTLKRLVPFE